jgi:hypothetical protein
MILCSLASLFLGNLFREAARSAEPEMHTSHIDRPQRVVHLVDDKKKSAKA